LIFKLFITKACMEYDYGPLPRQYGPLPRQYGPLPRQNNISAAGVRYLYVMGNV
jgi:hypothetical protein